MSLNQYVIQEVDPKKYYSKALPDIQWQGDKVNPRVLCPLHDDNKTPSLHVDPQTGAWYCHGCNEGGKSIVSFHAAVNEVPTSDAAIEIFRDYVHPIIPLEKVKEWQQRLRNTPSAIQYIKKRHISKDVVVRHKIGWDGTRIVFPVFNEFDLVTNARRYDPLASKHNAPKMVNYTDDSEERSYGSPATLYPLSSFDLARDRGMIVICEGEWDALALLSMGIPAITSTSGAQTWAGQYDEWFKGLEVVLAYDRDKAGGEGADKVFRRLMNMATTIRRLAIPKSVGKDVGDWIDNDPRMRTAAPWMRKIKRAKRLVENPENIGVSNEVLDVRLDTASEASTFGHRIRVDALVSGKGTAPYELPLKYRVTCNKSCDSCPLAETKTGYREVVLDRSNPRVLELLDIPESKKYKMMLAMAGMNPKPGCQAEVQEVEMFNIEQLLLIPTIDSDASQYVMRTGYYVGHGLRSNCSYQFQGCTIPHPRDQTVTHLFDQAKPVQGEVDTFQMTPELREQLKVFQPGNKRIGAHLVDIADWQSRHITKIKSRPDLHIAVDLAFHSVGSFIFNGETIDRGMLDMLVIGDTRCGKGFVTERLCRHYRLGEVASGENCSFAGLVGGVQQVGKRWFITWGVIPLNNQRLVVIDEASALSPDDFGKMSRVRSEGVAEIAKIVKESTQANTRLIWLSNPRSGRSLREYNTGVEAVKELVGGNEDLSRFDLVLSVATDEVPSEIINAVAHEDEVHDDEKYPARLSRALVLWAWSRTADQVVFTDGATELVIHKAIEFGNKYSPAIPLVQAENIRVKIAKIAVAVAARLFSTDDTGEHIVVSREHVQYACSFIREAYAKQSLAYDTFSRSYRDSLTIEDTKSIRTIIEKWVPDGAEKVIDAFMRAHIVSAQLLGDYVGDPMIASDLIGELVKAKCLSRREDGRGYMKNPDFTKWIRNQMRSKHSVSDRKAIPHNRRSRKGRRASINRAER
jgi:hypothetical protein